MSERLKSMLGASPSAALIWANEVRIWATALAAVAGVIAFVATWAQIRLQAAVGAAKEAEATAYREAAELRAAELQNATARSQVEAEQAKAAAAQAMVEQMRLQESAVRLAVDLERARAETLSIQRGLASRRLGMAQTTALTAALSAINPRLNVRISCNGEAEPAAFRDELASAFADAGFAVEPIVSQMPSVEGTVLYPSADDAHVPVLRAFAQAGITVQVANARVDGMVFIYVGRKPPAF